MNKTPYLSVIKFPVRMAESIKRRTALLKKKQREQQLKQSRRGNLKTPIITAKRPEFNFYYGQSYSKFSEIPLASKGWKHKKAVGDYFVVHGYGENPSVSSEVEQLSFSELGLENSLLEQIDKMGFTEPTTIQSLAIPRILQGTNSLLAAETGNGKTLAFLAPLLQQVLQRKRILGGRMVNAPLGVVISPGRELTEQIQDTAVILGEPLEIKSRLLLGTGVKKRMLNPEMEECDILVASFGALSKFTTVGIYDMKFVRHIVIDEADTLLDDSFSEKMVHYLSKFPIQGAQADNPDANVAFSGIQLTLVGATFPQDLKNILHDVVEVDSLEFITTPALHMIQPHVTQHFLRVKAAEKDEVLMEAVRKNVKNKIPTMIFSNTAEASDWVAGFLNENGVKCIRFNAKMSPRVRKGRFESFQNGEADIISCTDIASRGLDTVRVEQVINFEFPKYMADYIHRCGRVGRVGSSTRGTVINYVHKPGNIELVQKIEYAARRSRELPGVDANIKRILTESCMNEPIV